MSQIDNELALLKQKIAALEEQKRIETEKEEKKKDPLKILQRILNEKKKLRNVLKDCARTGPSFMPHKNISISTEEFAWLADQNDKTEFLEPIFTLLKSIDERLQNLEKKNIPVEDLLVLDQ